jgi:SAM-dependent methyltransferase
MSTNIPKFDDDLKSALQHRNNILSNNNLLYWYERLYQEQMKRIGYKPGFRVLEVGSGSSVLKTFFPEVITSDFLPMPHVDFCIDAQKLDQAQGVGKDFDAIVMTNVLHHVQMPLKLFESSTRILKPGGRISMLEPYFSLMSTTLYKATQSVHKEGIDFSVKSPDLPTYVGPLTSANMAIPQLMLLQGKFFTEVLESFTLESTEYFTSLSYFMTGGTKRNYRIPKALYETYFSFDQRLTDLFPRLFASFFLATLERKT